MTRPGTQIIARDQAPPRSTPPTETGVWFAVGATGTGPEAPVLVRSMSSYEATFGNRQGGAVLYDAVETFFREGGSRVYISAVPTVPTQLSAEQVAIDTSSLDTKTRAELDAIATQAGLDPADYANKDEAVKAIRDAAGNGVSAAPRVITPADVEAALDRFDSGLGPGQVSAPGIFDAVTQQALLEHAEAHNRVALLDGPDDPATTAATLTAMAQALKTLAQTRYGGLFCPWATIPGVTIGTTRSVPYSAVEAGLMARNDIAFNPNVPAAGFNGQSAYAIDLASRYTDLEYEQLNDAGVNMARLIYGGVETYGYRTLVDAAVNQLWLSLGNSRLNMAIVAKADVIAERYVFAQLDGRRKKVSQFGAELSAMLVPYYEQGALYGTTPDEAFFVDVGEQVNTDATLAAGELHAVIKLRMSPFAELVVIEIVKVAVTESLTIAA